MGKAALGSAHLRLEGKEDSPYLAEKCQVSNERRRLRMSDAQLLQS